MLRGPQIPSLNDMENGKCIPKAGLACRGPREFQRLADYGAPLGCGLLASPTVGPRRLPLLFVASRWSPSPPVACLGFRQCYHALYGTCLFRRMRFGMLLGDLMGGWLRVFQGGGRAPHSKSYNAIELYGQAHTLFRPGRSPPLPRHPTSEPQSPLGAPPLSNLPQSLDPQTIEIHIDSIPRHKYVRSFLLPANAPPPKKNILEY